MKFQKVERVVRMKITRHAELRTKSRRRRSRRTVAVAPIGKDTSTPSHRSMTTMVTIVGILITIIIIGGFLDQVLVLISDDGDSFKIFGVFGAQKAPRRNWPFLCRWRSKCQCRGHHDDKKEAGLHGKAVGSSCNRKNVLQQEKKMNECE